MTNFVYHLIIYKVVSNILYDSDYKLYCQIERKILRLFKYPHVYSATQNRKHFLYNYLANIHIKMVL